MLFIPPRHGKSTLSTIYYPAYRLEQDPSLRVIIACYNQTLAEKFSRRVRAIIRLRGNVALNPERQAVDDWETVAGGGLRAVGVGGGVTGMGADLIVIDDPVKSRAEANSATYRDACWEWYTNDLYTRLEPGGAVVLIMTRWHEDDLAGRILESENGKDWTVIRLPAEAEADDPLGRSVGDALCPDRYSTEALADLSRTLMGDYAALFQQRPSPEGGGMFKAGRVGFVGAVPSGSTWVRRWDVASSDGTSDWTCGILMARNGDRYYIADMVLGQWSTDERDRIIRQTAELDNRGKSVKTILPQDPGSAGKDMALAFTRLLAGYNVETERETGDKVVRASPLASQWNVGDGKDTWNVALLRADWNARYLIIMQSFPSAKHDDAVDASSGAFNALAVGEGSVWFA